VNRLLRLYPESWRKRYGEEFVALLAASPWTWRALADVVLGAFDAHQRKGGPQMRRLMLWGLLAVIAAFLGWLNYRASDDVQPVAAGLLLAGFAFSFWRPRLAWLFVLILWLAIPLSGVIAFANNYHPGLLKPHPLYETLVALIPTALGAMVGAGARWIVGQARA
jgi:uncharacterized membrane protein YfcA